MMWLLLLAREFQGDEPGERTDGGVLDGIPDHVLPMNHAPELTLQSP